METFTSREAIWIWDSHVSTRTATVEHDGHWWGVYVTPCRDGLYEVIAGWGDTYWGASSFLDALDRADQMIRAHA